MKKLSRFNKFGIVTIPAFLFALLFTYFEIRTIWNVQQNWEKLLSPPGLAAISAYTLLFLGQGFCFFRGLSFDVTTTVVSKDSKRRDFLQWPIIVFLLVLYTWIYLYSPWQDVLPGPWTQLLFAAGSAQVLSLLAIPIRQRKYGWSEISLTLALFLYPRIVHEVRDMTSPAGVYRAVTIGGFLLIIGLIFFLYHPFGDKIRISLASLRNNFSNARWIVITVLWCAPFIYRYSVGAETYIQYPNLQFLIILLAIWLTAFFTTGESDRLVSSVSLGLNMGLVILISAVTGSLLLVVDYPFSITWSEGNRFYDYSLVFGQTLYNYKGHIVNPYTSPGRYGLWGLLFLWDGLPIWVHRFWNIVLQTLPPLVFSYLITRKLTPASLRYGMFLWITLFFVVIAPLHPPFMLVSILVVLFAFDPSPIKRGILLVIASYYASLSRWTWVFAPAAIGALIDLILYYPARQGTLFRRILPTSLLVFFAVLPGIVQSVGRYLSYIRKDDLTSNQPLLWYRLLPNDTLGPGVLFLALYTTGPLLILLVWWIASRRWKLDFIQKLAIFGALFSFFAIGLVISTKIGGGGDLHNLDMYLVSLMVVITLALTTQVHIQEPSSWPAWAVGMVVLLIFIPVYGFTPLNPSVSNGGLLNLAKQAEIKKSLSELRSEVENAIKNGDVLFMDQRQLLTFKYVGAIPLVPEYEKKYMMDQAMGNNGRYFDDYYKDLANRRFALIVTEPLRSKLKSEMGGAFSEENDAWVTWVSNPTLCFYEPIYISKGTDVELLVPRENPVGCEEYLK